MKNKLSVILSTMGVLAILCTLFIWFWLGTVGLFVGMGGVSYAVLLIPAALGVFPLVVGIGILRRRRWSRLFLIIFWFLVSLHIIGVIILNLQDSIENFQLWAAEAIPWLCVASIGILHIIFLKQKRVKELFDGS